jgi:BirA family biotin operon repressor/biotin-[acetyl-CoA-carboxylase] ligase
VLIRPTTDAADLHLLTQWVALAAVDACAEVTGVTPELKWPNDLMVGPRKLAGILAESIVSDTRASAVAIGIGINVTSAPPEAVALNQLSSRLVTVETVLDALLRALGDGPDPAAIRTAYRQRLSTVGQRVRVELADGHFEGIAQAVGDDGLLEVIAFDGERRRVSAGDVVHLRSAD